MNYNFDTGTMEEHDFVGSVHEERINGREHRRRILEFSLVEGLLELRLGPSYVQEGKTWLLADGEEKFVVRTLAAQFFTFVDRGFSLDLHPQMAFYYPNRPEAQTIPPLDMVELLDEFCSNIVYDCHPSGVAAKRSGAGRVLVGLGTRAIGPIAAYLRDLLAKQTDIERISFVPAEVVGLLPNIGDAAGLKYDPELTFGMYDDWLAWCDTQAEQSNPS